MQLGTVINEVDPVVPGGDCLETFQARVQEGAARQSGLEFLC